MIDIVNNKNLIEDVHKYDVILVPMDINSSIGNGFRHEIVINFPDVKEEESYSGYGDKRKYGTINPIESNDLIFCICYMYTMPTNKQKGNDNVRYDALELCLRHVKSKFEGKRIASPILGNSKFDGNGDKEKILTIFNNVFGKDDITLYDYEQEDYKKKLFTEIAILHKRFIDKELTSDEYIKLRSEVEWRRRHGIYNPIPETYKYIPRFGEVKN